MNRIDRIFHDLRTRGERALMPFVTAGYPTLEATEALLPALQRGGASICELGFPFSDPIADGPTIQASMSAALDRGFHPADTFEMVRRRRAELDLGVVAMVSFSIVYRMGVKQFIAWSQQAGVDGFIFPDLPLEEAEAVVEPVRDAGLISSLLISPTTPPERAAAIAQRSTGFIYLVARTGITGAREDLPPELPQRVEQLREVTDLPIAVGFGISQPKHVRAVTEVADAAIVGSALVKRLSDLADQPPDRIAAEAERFIADLATGLAGDS